MRRHHHRCQWGCRVFAVRQLQDGHVTPMRAFPPAFAGLARSVPELLSVAYVPGDQPVAAPHEPPEARQENVVIEAWRAKQPVSRRFLEVGDRTAPDDPAVGHIQASDRPQRRHHVDPAPVADRSRHRSTQVGRAPTAACMDPVPDAVLRQTRNRLQMPLLDLGAQFQTIEGARSQQQHVGIGHLVSGLLQILRRALQELR